MSMLPFPPQHRGQTWASWTLIALVTVALLTLGLTPAANAAGPLSWSAPELVDHQAHTAQGGISCPSTSLCVAVDEAGNILTSTDPAGGASTWSAPVSVDPGHALSQVSCPTAGLCVAVDNAGNVVTSTSPTGGVAAWSVAHIATDVSGTLGVTCVSASLCMVVGVDGLIYSANPAGGAGTWTTTGVPPVRWTRRTTDP
jgi:hypothetical protein